MDRNQIIGILLMVVLFASYYYWFAPEPVEPPVQKEQAPLNTPSSDNGQQAAFQQAPELPDSIKAQIAQSNFGAFANLAQDNSGSDLHISNEVFDVIISAKGGSIKKVTLKDYKTYGGQPLTLIDENNSEQHISFSSAGKNIKLDDLNFTASTSNQTIQSGDSLTIKLVASIANGQEIYQTYTFKGDSYVIDRKLGSSGLSGIIDNENLSFSWQASLYQLEKDLKEERTRSVLNYSANKSTSDLGIRDLSREEENFEENLDWAAFTNKFFISSVIPSKTTGSVQLVQEGNEESTDVVKYMSANFNIPVSEFLSEGYDLKYYFGPKEYDILTQVTPNFDENIDFGYGPLAWINKFFTRTVFNFLKGFIGSFGVIILIMVIIIRLILSPLTYKSHMSMAKMRILKPELDAIKEKHDGDMQKSQPEQMELYKKAGINPISGCIPMVLQMPILFSMFYFFPRAIDLRQKSFLWADDLSVYDSIWDFGFEIPFYGDHMSLFTLLMTASTILYTWSNSQVSSVTGPMKTVQYVMPIMFLFFLNSYSAGLTFYYFVSNIFSFSQIALFKKLVNEDKIKAVMEENKKKNVNKKKSKFANRLESAMKASEESRRQKKKIK